MKTFKSGTAILVMAVATLVSGCIVVHDRSSARAGYFYGGGRWHHIPGHIHGPGCGHELRGSVWVEIP